MLMSLRQYAVTIVGCGFLNLLIGDAGGFHAVGEVVGALAVPGVPWSSSGVTMPMGSGESIVTVVAMASRKPCGLTERPNAAVV